MLARPIRLRPAVTTLAAISSAVTYNVAIHFDISVMCNVDNGDTTNTRMIFQVWLGHSAGIDTYTHTYTPGIVLPCWPGVLAMADLSPPRVYDPHG